MKAKAWMMPLAMLALAGCVTAHIDYPLGDVRPTGRGKYRAQVASLDLRDGRYADKTAVTAYAHKKGTYNQGVAFPKGLTDYAEVFGSRGAGGEATYYTAPDRLYWKPAGPMDDLRERLTEHLRRAGVLKEAIHAGLRSPVGDGGVQNQVSGGTLEVTLKRFVALKERRSGIDTFGFFGISALARSREIMAVKADWRLLDASGRVLDGGTIEFTTDEDGSCWRAKNKPFALNNRAARMLGDALVKALRP